MPSFVTRVTLTLDGEKVEVKTNASDQLNAERGTGKAPLDTPVELGMRVWYCALRRQWPDHPASKTFRAFVDALEAADDGDGDDDTELDPTRPADSAGWQ